MIVRECSSGCLAAGLLAGVLACAGVVADVAAYRAKVKDTPGLVDYYSFEENFDDEFYGTNGVNNGVPAVLAPTFGDGLNPGGNGVSFSGLGDVVTITRSVEREFTIVAWVRTETPGVGGDLSQFFQGSGLIYADIGGVANDFGMAITGAKFAFGIGNPDMTIHSTTDAVTNQWTFISAVRRIDTTKGRTDLRLYVNGVLEDSLEHTNVAALTAQSLITIGGNTIDSRFFTGTVDEVGIFGEALDEAAIQALFAAFSGTEEPRFLRGDSDRNGLVDITDAVLILSVLGLGSGTLRCQSAADSDDNGTINITDAVRILNVLFLGIGTIPEPGFEECGLDPTPDDLGCVTTSDVCE